MSGPSPKFHWEGGGRNIQNLDTTFDRRCLCVAVAAIYGKSITGLFGIDNWPRRID